MTSIDVHGPSISRNSDYYDLPTIQRQRVRSDDAAMETGSAGGREPAGEDSGRAARHRECGADAAAARVGAATSDPSSSRPGCRYTRSNAVSFGVQASGLGRADSCGTVSFFEQPSNVTLAVQHTNDFKRLRVGTVDHQVPEHRPESYVLGSEVRPKMADSWVIGEELHRVVKASTTFRTALGLSPSRYSRIFSKSLLAACARAKSLTMLIGSSV